MYPLIDSSMLASIGYMAKKFFLSFLYWDYTSYRKSGMPASIENLIHHSVKGEEKANTFYQACKRMQALTRTFRGDVTGQVENIFYGKHHHERVQDMNPFKIVQ